MDMSGALAARLAALADPGVDLPGMVEAVHDALLAAVPSGLGLSITIRGGATDVIVTTVEPGAVAAASLWVPLEALADVQRGSCVVFYAGTPGSLVDLAADLGWTLRLEIVWADLPLENTLVLDRHLVLDPDAGSVSGLSELSVVDRAVGVLLARGHTPDLAVRELRTAADKSHLSVPAVAARLMSDLVASSAARIPDLAALGPGHPWIGVAAVGDHLCGLYRGRRQRDELLLPYLRAGLLAGDRCLCLIDQPDPTTVQDGLPDGVSDAPRGVSMPRDLSVARATDVYLRSGRFSADDMIGFLTEAMIAVEDADRDRWFRAVGEMSWVNRHPAGTSEFFGYESAVNRLAAEHRTVLLCLYDLDNLDEAMLTGVLTTHPTVLYNGQVMTNPYYLTPDEYSALA